MEGTVTVRLVEDIRQKPKRAKCFSLRKIIDSSPRVYKFYKICLGVYVITHVFAAFLIFTIGSEAQTILWALYPLLFLALQTQVLCILMIGIIISDIINQTILMAVWQRSAIGRILRNTFISFMALLFFSLCLVYTETSSNQILFVSVAKISVPLIILILITFVRFLLIKGDSSCTWLTICFCSIAEVVILIIHNDFHVKIQAIIVILPLLIAISALGFSLVERLKLELFKNLGGILSCLSFASYLVIKAAFLDEWPDQQYYYDFPGFLGFFLLYWNYSQSVGVFVLDIIFGHVETDYNYSINPPVRNGIKSCTT